MHKKFVGRVFFCSVICRHKGETGACSWVVERVSSLCATITICRTKICSIMIEIAGCILNVLIFLNRHFKHISEQTFFVSSLNYQTSQSWFFWLAAPERIESKKLNKNYTVKIAVLSCCLFTLTFYCKLSAMAQWSWCLVQMIGTVEELLET